MKKALIQITTAIAFLIPMFSWAQDVKLPANSKIKMHYEDEKARRQVSPQCLQ